jgi:hypothetical protein
MICFFPFFFISIFLFSMYILSMFSFICLHFSPGLLCFLSIFITIPKVRLLYLTLIMILVLVSQGVVTGVDMQRCKRANIVRGHFLSKQGVIWGFPRPSPSGSLEVSKQPLTLKLSTKGRIFFFYYLWPSVT